MRMQVQSLVSLLVIVATCTSCHVLQIIQASKLSHGGEESHCRCNRVCGWRGGEMVLVLALLLLLVDAVSPSRVRHSQPRARPIRRGESNGQWLIPDNRIPQQAS